MKKIRLILSEHRRLKGFTFLELLIVIGLIGILTVIAVVSYGSVNRRSRDARRKSDIEQVRSALEMYRADWGYYPDEGPASFTRLSTSGLGTPLQSYIGTLPSDPKDDENLPYQIIMTDLRGIDPNIHYYGYCLAAYVEAEVYNNSCTELRLPMSTDESVQYTYGVKNP